MSIDWLDFAASDTILASFATFFLKITLLKSLKTFVENS
jgi:hypothetical protein